MKINLTEVQVDEFLGEYFNDGDWIVYRDCNNEVFNFDYVSDRGGTSCQLEEINDILNHLLQDFQLDTFEDIKKNIYTKCEVDKDRGTNGNTPYEYILTCIAC